MSVGTTGGGQQTGQNITVDSGSNRILAVGVGQIRSPNNIPEVASGYSLDAGTYPATGIITYQASGTSNVEVVGVYWLETDLPTAGTYTLDWSPNSTADDFVYLNATNMAQEAPEVTDTVDLGADTTTTDTLTGITTGAVVLMFSNPNDTTPNFVQNTGTMFGPTGSDRIAGAYTTSGATVAIDNDSAIRCAVVASFAPLASLPTITSIGGDNDVYPGESTNWLGTNFGASQTGSAAAILSPTNDVSDSDAVDQGTAGTWADTQLSNVSIDQGSLAYGTAYGFVKNSSGDANASGKAITLSSPSGYQNATLTAVDVDGLKLVWPSLAIGDQVELPTTSTQGGTVTVDANGGGITIDYSPSSTPASDTIQPARWRDASTPVWSASVGSGDTITINGGSISASYIHGGGMISVGRMMNR